MNKYVEALHSALAEFYDEYKDVKCDCGASMSHEPKCELVRLYQMFADSEDGQQLIEGVRQHG